MMDRLGMAFFHRWNVFVYICLYGLLHMLSRVKNKKKSVWHQFGRGLVKLVWLKYGCSLATVTIPDL